ncbi:MAG TPA: hypothetical protein DCP97_03410 [Ruminococcaceae bacterium]|nr:hypothetical protein [Oscillospiraceae bacterium]
MKGKNEIKVIWPENLMQSVLELKHKGYRLVQMCATRLSDGFELSYTFALEYDTLVLRLIIETETEISSISTVYAPAFLYENEMKDLFGVKIKLITIDYDGSLYRVAEKTPFKEANNNG